MNKSINKWNLYRNKENQDMEKNKWDINTKKKLNYHKKIKNKKLSHDYLLVVT